MASLPVGPPASSAGSLARMPWAELSIPCAVLAIVLALVVPLPAALLDVLLSANITISVLVLLVAIYIRKPVEFSVFPTVLLLLTLFRLALNVSTSRLILLNGNAGTTAAGDVIEAFGSFVVGGNYFVGTVMFLVLIAIQYVVINHGAVRISEVTARFTLDALPGKQMSIDSDLSNGLIDEAEARRRRASLASEAEFYGAMDGASRFTQRDAVASILITGINIAAGLLVGLLQYGMDVRHALETYTVLTIGDGLVTVIPALMISVSGGLIVTRASSETKLAGELQRQIFSEPQPLLLASGVLATMALLPGLPKLPFIVLAAAVGTAGWRLQRSKSKNPAAQPAAAVKARKDDVEAALRVEPLSVDVGLSLVRYVDGGPSSPLLRRIAALRRQLAAELGYILPPVRVSDDMTLRPREYRVSVRGVEVARFEFQPGCDLALETAAVKERLDGRATRDPAYHLPAIWVPAEQAEEARGRGYSVVDTVSVISTHLSEVARSSAHELFTRQEARKFLDRVAENNPRAVEDLVPKQLPLAAVQKVLQHLLRERVSLRDASSIVEALGEGASVTRNTTLLTEYVRQAIRRMLVQPYLNSSGELLAFFLDPALEQMIERAVEHTEHVSHLSLAPQQAREIADRTLRTLGQIDTPTVILTSSSVRFFLRQILENTVGNAIALSHNEVPAGVKVISLGTIR